MKLLIAPDGNVRCLYTEMLDLNVLGPPRIKRASHVEPTADGQWTADLALSNGPILGPFPTRSEALAAETDWLLRHRLMNKSERDPEAMD